MCISKAQKQNKITLTYGGAKDERYHLTSSPWFSTSTEHSKNKKKKTQNISPVCTFQDNDAPSYITKGLFRYFRSLYTLGHDRDIRLQRICKTTGSSSRAGSSIQSRTGSSSKTIILLYSSRFTVILWSQKC